MTNVTFRTEMTRTLAANAILFMMAARWAKEAGETEKAIANVRWARRSWKEALERDRRLVSAWAGVAAKLGGS